MVVNSHELLQQCVLVGGVFVVVIFNTVTFWPWIWRVPTPIQSEPPERPPMERVDLRPRYERIPLEAVRRKWAFWKKRLLEAI